MTVVDADLAGLSDADVRARIARGETNDVPAVPTRSVGQILRANLLTRFNILLGGLLAVILVVGDVRDALFGLVLVANSAIGIGQELRAKHTLDRLVLLTAPRARVVRSGDLCDVAASDVVLDDVLELRPGDQVVVDGVVLAQTGLEVDETLLTGESDAVEKAVGGGLLSGSFVAAGSGRYRASRVGGDAYASEIAARARDFTLFASQLRRDIDVILRLATWALVPTAVLLVVSQLRVHVAPEPALAASVGGVVAMVPEGLVLLTSTAFAVAVVRLARHRTLVQELPAVEGLARVDVLCLDKTGTLTRGAIAFDRLEVLAGGDGIEAAVGAMAASDPNPNATLRALATQFEPPDGWRATDAVAFSSARGYAATAFGPRGTWVLGAPDVLLGDGPDPAVDRLVAAHVEDGRRVLLLAHTSGTPGLRRVPADLEPRALVVLSDQVRPDAAEVLGAFARDGITVKLISGDDPRTVAALARRAGITAVGEVDARGLPDDGPELAAAVASGTVFGRVRPQQKQAMVAALQAAGHVVAMTGDGVNDVLAVKRADLGIAMGSGSPATCAVAQLVLLDDQFAALPAALGEGRRVIGNVERLARLFVTKSVYSLLLALAVGVAVLPFPFLPRHLTLIGTLTIGVPGVALAIAPNTSRARPGMVDRVLRFAVPAGLVAAAATFAGYYVTRLLPDVDLDEARTTATLVLLSVGLLVLARLLRPLTRPRRALIAAMAVAMVLAVVVPPVRTFFALDPPPPIVVLAAIGIVAISERLLRLDDLVAARRRPPSGVAAAATAARAWLQPLVTPPYGTSLAALGLIAACMAGVVVLHLTRPDLDPLHHVLSEYANGPFGVVMTAVFYAAGVACAALAWRLRTALRWQGVTVATPALLAVAGVGMVGAGAFEVGLPTAPDDLGETVHSLASIGAFVALIAAMALFARACGRDPAWRGFRAVAWVLAGVAIAAAVASPLAGATPWAGAAQRVLAGTVAAWLLVTARQVRTVAFRLR